MGAAVDPCDAASRGDEDGGGVGHAPGVEGDAVVDAVGLHDGAVAVDEPGPRQWVFGEPVADGVWALTGDDGDADVLFEVARMIAQDLRQPATAVGSEGAAEEEEEDGAGGEGFAQGERCAVCG